MATQLPLLLVVFSAIGIVRIYATDNHIWEDLEDHAMFDRIYAKITELQDRITRILRLPMYNGALPIDPAIRAGWALSLADLQETLWRLELALNSAHVIIHREMDQITNLLRNTRSVHWKEEEHNMIKEHNRIRRALH
ncbi:hypothetical protein Aduo_007940 [Ancylostoma duodenale]